MIPDYLFFFLSFVAIFCALMVVFSKNPVHSVLFLILTFFAIAGHYVLMNAQFLAVVHVMVYAGAIMVLFLFTIMLLNLNSDTEPQHSALIKVAGVISGGLLMLILVASLKGASQAHTVVTDPTIGLTQRLGQILFRDYAFPLEVSSLLFLSAMVGAVLLAKKEMN
jgi:NADH-quinone oxidoreductase subunit J